MSKIPLTRIPASEEKAAAIRQAVRTIAFPANSSRRLAEISDALTFYALIADPRVSDPIYTLPKPPTLEAAHLFIERHVEEHLRGEGLLIFEFDEAGAVCAYYDIQFWPEWSACELGGAVRPDRQGSGAGGAGAAAAFDWLFNAIGVDPVLWRKRH